MSKTCPEPSQRGGVGFRRLPGDRTLIALLLGLLVVGLGGCHRVEVGKLEEKPISTADKFFDVAHANGDTFVIVGYRGEVLRSTDAGKTWQEVPRPTELSLTDVEFVGEYGWAAGQGGMIVHSRDCGQTWNTQPSNTDVTLMAISFAPDKLHGWASGDLSTVVSTENGGETWSAQRIEVSQVGLTEDIALAIPDLIYYDVHFLNEKEGWMVGEYGNIRHTTDGGKTWDSQHQSLLDQMTRASRDVMALPALFRIRFWDSQKGLAIGASGDIIGTQDGGQYWYFIAKEGDRGALSLQQPRLVENVPPVHLYNLFLDPSPNGPVVVVGASGVAMQSSSGGATWEISKLPLEIYTWINGADFNENGKGVVVGGKGLILRTEDWGKTWLLPE